MRICLAILPAAVLAAGCGYDPDTAPVVPHPVTGKVLYDGKPAAGVVVTFMPSDAPTVPRIPRNPRGVTGPDGTFTLTTFADGDGAAEGGYQVVLSWPDETAVVEESDEEKESKPDRLMGWYDPLHSALNYRVTPGENAVPAFELKKVTRPPQAAQGVPGRN